MKIIAWESIFTQKSTSLLFMFLIMVLGLVGSIYFESPLKAHVELEAMYKAGTLTNATEALIALEKIKASRSKFEVLMPLLSMWGVVLVLYAGGAFLLPRLSPSYNFYWGEYTAYYDKRIRFRTALMTLVVLSLVVSVMANFVSKKLGI